MPSYAEQYGDGRAGGPKAFRAGFWRRRMKGEKTHAFLSVFFTATPEE